MPEGRSGWSARACRRGARTEPLSLQGAQGVSLGWPARPRGLRTTIGDIATTSSLSPRWGGGALHSRRTAMPTRWEVQSPVIARTSPSRGCCVFATSKGRPGLPRYPPVARWRGAPSTGLRGAPTQIRSPTLAPLATLHDVLAPGPARPRMPPGPSGTRRCLPGRPYNTLRSAIARHALGNTQESGTADSGRRYEHGSRSRGRMRPPCGPPNRATREFFRVVLTGRTRPTQWLQGGMPLPSCVWGGISKL